MLLALHGGATPARELPGWRKPRKVLVLNAQPGRVAELQAVAPGVGQMELKPQRPGGGIGTTPRRAIQNRSNMSLSRGP